MTLGAALSVAAAALAAGLLVQRVALSEPDSATFSALRAATWLSRYRLVDSTFSVNGGATVHGRCLQDWFVADGRRRRGAVLRLDDGLVVLDVRPHTLTVAGGDGGRALGRAPRAPRARRLHARARAAARDARPAAARPHAVERTLAFALKGRTSR